MYIFLLAIDSNDVDQIRRALKYASDELYNNPDELNNVQIVERINRKMEYAIIPEKLIYDPIVEYFNKRERTQ